MRALVALLVAATTADARKPPVLELGFGFGALTGNDDKDVDISRTRHILVGSSLYLTKPLDLVVTAEAFGGNYSPEPALEQSVLTFLAGVRWFPCGRVPDDTPTADNLKSIYLQATTGIALLTLVPYNELFDSQDPEAVGVAGSGAIGWLPVRIHGTLSFGAEVRDDVIYFSNDQGLRQALSLYGWIQVDFD